MNHFKELFITLQTLNIRVAVRHAGRDGEAKSYDLRHENPFLNVAFQNRLKELKELALVDLMNQGREQIHFQLKRLEDLKQVFHKFWERFYHSRVPVGSEFNLELLLSLNLNEIFICQFLSFQDYASAGDEFLDDLQSTVRYRQEILAEVEQSVAKVLRQDDSAVAKTSMLISRATPTFKEGIKIDFYNLIREHFSADEKERLKDLLNSPASSVEPLEFHGAGNQLADAFKQLFDSNLIVGCNKAELEAWIMQHFRFRDGNNVKSYTEKYLQDMISSNTKACQSPLFDVRKTGSEFVLTPLIRNNKKANNKQGSLGIQEETLVTLQNMPIALQHKSTCCYGTHHF